jgi:uncharacterized LabA/DUF88 family protein
MDMAKAMYFVDGENLAIRYGAYLKQTGKCSAPAVDFEPNVFVWSPQLNDDNSGVIRKHYYTTTQNDGVKIQDIENRLKMLGIEAPRVFPKDKTKGSKRVDISLATEMLVHATRQHYDIAVLVAGDEDYVPLVRAVQSEGARVHVWFIENGISPELKAAADSFLDIAYVLAVDQSLPAV